MKMKQQNLKLEKRITKWLMTNKQTKTDSNEDDNENEAKMKSEDKEKIQLSKCFIAISARPTRERGKARAKYMSRSSSD